MLVLFFSAATLHAQEKYLFVNINTEYDEQNPVLSPDGQVLYFTRSNHAENAGGVLDKGDIWYSELMPDRSWSVPKNARRLNNKGWNAVLGFSSDGSTIYLHNHYTEMNNRVKTQGIAKAQRRTGGWSAPEDIDIPYFKNLSAIQGGSISMDGKVLVLSIESYGTKGAEDIYVVLKKGNDQWGEPKNLGSTVNSKYQEFTPFLADDNRTLYFSSNGRGGKGSSDVFVTQRLDDSWTNWSTPQGVDEVNTKGRELGYRLYEGFAIYSSTISSDGYSDLKIHTDRPLDSIIVVKEPEVKLDSGIRIVEAGKETLVAGPAITVYGKVKDVNTQDHIDAIVTIEHKDHDFKKEVATADDNGYYSLSIPAAGIYEVRIDAPGYISKRETLDVYTREMKLVEMNYELQPISVGTTVNLKNVLFQQSTANILDTSYEELDLVADIMKQNPSMKIRLEGHTDNRGVAKHNQRLSKKRVEAVEEYLVKKGISSNRISGKGYGGSKPIADNEDPELRKLNRRVEFTIVKE
ncbi:outer membrane protein, OmpA/MotB family [Fulvivirga imtechensis AK7]|uniref:Outer membrane protein, OmpA/MotB family n=1 Tax=Fulvivirga imtechensis AK7 TaxID=1237149 RepID=L8JPD3_9BACT|nr:OmpA family protein [Fulvivirga imtechensis]ELR70796.1 outer membrane protein, OmpA/MotB family [Fulvivirga imtechensis AK7]